MGAIKDGTISGTLPEAKVFAVHYPGYPSSTSRAVETLGGPEAITKVRSSQSNCLELRFRPEDPYSHPAFGELHRCSGFLLKISKKKFSADQNAVASSIMSKCLSKDATSSVPVPCDSESKEVEERNLPEIESTSSNKDKEVQMHKKMLINLYVDIVARVSEAYQFNGMVDYQHVLAVHGDVARRKRRWVEVEPRFEKGGLIDIDLEDLMMLVPPIFSPKNIPEKLVLRPSGLLSSKKKQEAVVQNRWETKFAESKIKQEKKFFELYLQINEMDIEPCIAIDFNIEEIPRKVNWEEHIPQGSAHWEWQTVLAKLFDERPIWHKHTLNQRLLEEGLHFGAHQLKRLLFRIAYYFATGPFRLFWIRKGYDPRKDSESRIYQTIDFRVPPPLRSFGNIDTTNELKDRWKEICAFQVFPSKNQTSFQVFDLVDDYIQEEIRKPIEQTTCTSSTGWFSSHLLDSLRLRVATRFLSVYPKLGAKDLLKSVSERFEKSKWMQVLRKDSRSGEEEKEENQQNAGVSPTKCNHSELVSNDGKDEPDDDDDGDDEDEDDEIEDEEDDEELEDYELLHMAGEDGDFSLQSCYTNGENISKNYLQELFGSFPSAEAGRSKGQDADISDGEYQIYEQDSGDNDDHFDDDDY